MRECCARAAVMDKLLWSRCFFFLMIRRPPISPLFPYPTLFRSHAEHLDAVLGGADAAHGDPRHVHGLPPLLDKVFGHWQDRRPGQPPPPALGAQEGLAALIGRAHV